jgi:predicted N-acetyltransferase YhbS
MHDVQIAPFDRSKTAPVSRALARAFVTNPAHIAAFGSSQLAKNEAFFRVALTWLKGTTLVATDDFRIVGAVHWVSSPACQFGRLEKLCMAPAMIAGFGMTSAMCVGSWLSAWAAEDPPEPHVHLGPIGVAPEAQGHRIGDTLMKAYLSELDRTRQPGYLETDRPENLAFYRRYGFELLRERAVLGVPNYFMSRKAIG